MLRMVITGADGCGKSTVCGLAAAELETLYGPGSVARVTVWDAIGGFGAFRTKEDAERYLLDLDGYTRTLFLFHAMSRAMDLAGRKRPKILLIEGYWYKYAVTEIGQGVPASLVIAAAAPFPVPDVTVCLDLDLETIWKRKQKASAYELGLGSQGDERARFFGFHRKLCHVWRDVETRCGGWLHLSSAERPEALSGEIVALLAQKKAVALP